MRSLIAVSFLAALAHPLAARTVDVKVTVGGYEPARIPVAPKEHLILNVTRVTDATCATEIVVPDAKVKKDLPLNQTVKVDLGVLPEGEHVFGCAMSLMINGTLVVGTPAAKTPYAPAVQKSTPR